MKKIYDLEVELKNLIEKNITIKTSTTDGILRVPEVFIGPIPSENPEEIVPAIGIITLSGANTLESKEINIETSIAIFIDDTEETYKKIYEMIDLIIEKILEKGIYLDEFEACTNTEWKIENNSIIMAASITFKFIRMNTYRKDVDDWINGR